MAYVDWQHQAGYAGYGYGGYGVAVPPQANNQLVLYNTAGSLTSFAPPPSSANMHNPFCPGLKPLPLVPPNKSFVETDPRVEKFPATTQPLARDDPLGWITDELFPSVQAQVVAQAEARGRALAELKAQAAHAHMERAFAAAHGHPHAAAAHHNQQQAAWVAPRTPHRAAAAAATQGQPHTPHVRQQGAVQAAGARAAAQRPRRA
mmetsp:Transcript_3412/g.8497  ORF Transcript_3412/g.8497 Transcript_3412/m.8497 type:complete len:205 (+) Transcript_3412:113-727(+)